MSFPLLKDDSSRHMAIGLNGLPTIPLPPPPPLPPLIK